MIIKIKIKHYSWKERKISNDQPLKECNLFQIHALLFPFSVAMYVWIKDNPLIHVVGVHSKRS